MELPHIPADATASERFTLAAKYIQAWTGAEKVAVIGVDAFGIQSMVSAGFVSHADLSSALALSIHLNLRDYDERQAAGEFDAPTEDTTNQDNPA